jgi:hypothetical protein
VFAIADALPVRYHTMALLAPPCGPSTGQKARLPAVTTGHDRVRSRLGSAHLSSGDGIGTMRSFRTSISMRDR